MYYNKKEYKFIGFQASKANHKKYAAIIQHKSTMRKRIINFGDNRYQQYKDITGLGLYSSKDHLDTKRRDSYKTRHQKDIKDGFFSAGYFSMKYLW
jgi:hypothetical protein